MQVQAETPAQGRYFNRVAGTVTFALPLWERAPRQAARSLRGLTPAQAAGIRYERKVFARLEKLFPGFISHLPLQFTNSSGERGWAIPDGLIITNTRITVVEVKLRHSLDPWFQLHRFYLPIVAAAFPKHRVKVLEVCKWYEPSVELPGDFEIIRDLSSYELREVSKYGVWVYTGR